MTPPTSMQGTDGRHHRRPRQRHEPFRAAARPRTPATLSIMVRADHRPGLRRGAADGDLATAGSFYKPGTATGQDSFRYTVQNGSGTSNVATVTVNVLPTRRAGPDGGERPVRGRHQRHRGLSRSRSTCSPTTPATAAPSTPTSVQISTAPTPPGSTVVNPVTGAVTYTAAAAGTHTFQYTVANLASSNGTVQTVGSGHRHRHRGLRREPGHHGCRAKCDRAKNQVAGARHEQHLDGQHDHHLPRCRRPADDGTGVSAPCPWSHGAWEFQRRTPPASTPISIQSTLGTRIQNISVDIK